MSGGEFGARGHITAYNATDGKQRGASTRVRSRATSAAPPGAVGEWMTCGSTVWSYPAIDTQTNTIYFTTSNADPWVDRGPGTNLFSSSIVALDTSTGLYRGHYQMVHHDIWDYDCPSPPILFDVMIDGGHPQGRGRGLQDRLALHPRPHDHAAADRDRREEGAAEQGAEHLADAAVPGRRRVRARSARARRCSRARRPTASPTRSGCIYAPITTTRVHRGLAGRARRHQLATDLLQPADELQLRLLGEHAERPEGTSRRPRSTTSAARA